MRVTKEILILNVLFVKSLFTRGLLKFKKTEIVIEVKWKNLAYKDALVLIENLKEKSGKFNSKITKRTFGVIAKRIEGKEKLRAEGYLAFDLLDFR